MSLYACLKDFLGQHLIDGCIDSPIFIIGMGRSGTSVLLQALGEHPAILAFPGEAPFLTSIGGEASLFNPALNTRNSDYYCASLKMDRDCFYKTLARLGLETAGGEHYALKEQIKAVWRRKKWASKHYWSAKTFPSESVAKGLLSVYPNAKFIYIVRNGIDVVHSMTKFHGFRDKEFASHCHRWHDSIAQYRYLIDNEHALFVRHEHLVSHPEAFFTAVFNFLQLAFESHCLKFVTETLVHPLDQSTRHQADVMTQLKERKSPFATWTTAQQDTFRAICSDSMAEMGYPLH
jgi:hypothetical protein